MAELAAEHAVRAVAGVEPQSVFIDRDFRYPESVDAGEIEATARLRTQARPTKIVEVSVETRDSDPVATLRVKALVGAG